MSQNRYYRIPIALFLLSFMYSAAFAPRGEEQSIKLSIGKHKKMRKYYSLDANLSYSLKNDTDKNKTFLVLVRKKVPSKITGSHEMGYSISINSESLASNNYTKGSDRAIFSDKYPGHAFTYPGEYLVTLEPSDKPYNIEIVPKTSKDKNKIFVRIVEWSPIQNYSEGLKLAPIDIQNTNSITRNNKSYDYYVLDPKETMQFKITGPRLVTINNRLKVHKNDTTKKGYKLLVSLDGTEIGNFYYRYRESGKSQIKESSNYVPSMWDRNRIYVPPGTHFISIKSNQSQNDVLIRAFEYKPK